MPQFSKFIKKFADVKVLVIGDVMLDRYLWGNVSRISPEAPVPIVNVKRTTHALGGAANVAANLVGLGAKPILTGICGTDKTADDLDELLIEKKIGGKLIRFENRQTTLKTRLIAHSQQIARIDHETTEPITNSDAEMILSRISDDLGNAAVIIISDYAKGFLTEDFLSRLITYANQNNKKIFVDPKGKNFKKYKNATILTPNRMESAIASGFTEDEPHLIRQAGEKILNEVETEYLLITQGEAGMTLLEKNGESFHLDALARNVYDVTGAGDTVIATLAAAVAAGANFLEAAQIANIAAGIVVGEVGTTAITAERLTQEIKNFELTRTKNA